MSFKRIICCNCNSIIEYDDKSIWEGNREREEIHCPVCGKYLLSVFTDLTPTPRLIKKGDGDSDNFVNNDNN